MNLATTTIGALERVSENRIVGHHVGSLGWLETVNSGSINGATIWVDPRRFSLGIRRFSNPAGGVFYEIVTVDETIENSDGEGLEYEFKV